MKTYSSSCITGSIEPYISELTPTEVKHFHNRLGFGVTFDDLERGVSFNSGADYVEAKINEVIALPLFTRPEWHDWVLANYGNTAGQQFGEQQSAWQYLWLDDMLNNDIRGRLTLFWHNHFVTKIERYACPSYMYQYYNLLERYMLGNFKEFVREIGLTPAMLVFLDGKNNAKGYENENYARELYELFTLGVDNNYTQKDIVETSKALTGYVDLPVRCDPIKFDQGSFNDSEKTIFEQKGNWGYDDVIDILFTHRKKEIANFICSKIYREFVSAEVDQDIVNALAITFLNPTNEFELAPVFKQLFKSQHFFDKNALGLIFKSPFEIRLNFFRNVDYPYNNDLFNVVLRETNLEGQHLFNPPTVAGWPGNNEWINTVTFQQRWANQRLRILLVADLGDEYHFIKFAKKVSNNSMDATVIVKSIVDHLLIKELDSEEAYQTAIDVFKLDIPINYFSPDVNGIQVWNLDFTPDKVKDQMAALLLHIISLPEYQLK